LASSPQSRPKDAPAMSLHPDVIGKGSWSGKLHPDRSDPKPAPAR
jgi:hypothetical protein